MCFVMLANVAPSHPLDLRLWDLSNIFYSFTDSLTMRMASRTVAQVRMALCQKPLTVLAAARLSCPSPASYHSIAFKTRHVAPLSASRSACRAGRAAFATQVGIVHSAGWHAQDNQCLA